MEELAGFLNIDKPRGPTSHDTCMMVRSILKTRENQEFSACQKSAGFLSTDKVGHSGTLDPQVTGVLPIAIGKATRLLRYLEHDKEYIGVMHMHEDIDKKKIEDAIKKHFLGKIKQTPPVKSRVKREEREREIYSFKILEKEGRDVLFSAHCEAGTYIRKLVDDLGRELGIGAHMLELRRIKAGQFEEKKSLTLYQLQEAVNSGKLAEHILPMEMIAKDMPNIEVKEDSLIKIHNGSPIYREYIESGPKTLEMGSFAAIMHNKKLVEIAKVLNEGNKIAVPETVIK